MHSGGDRLIRKVRNAGRRVGEAAAGSRGGRRAAKPRVDLHFRGLQEPAGELEAVLDDLDATSDPIFSGTAVDKNEQARFSSSAQQQHQGPRDKRDGGTRAREPPHVSTKSDEDDPLFPSDGEDVSADVGGDRRLPRQATGPTDSEESEDLDLDEAVAAEVLESLHLLGPDELFDSQSPPSSTVVAESWEREGGGGEESKRRQEIQGALAVNNESANNNTHIQEAGETLAPTASETLSSGGPLTHGKSVSVDDSQHYEPSLEELLEHGSAALPSRPYSSSPRRPYGSPRALDMESSPSPLTSSNESHPSDPLFTSTNQTLRPATREANGTRLPAVKHFGFDSKPPGSAEQKGLAQEQAVNGNDNMVPKPPAHSPTSGSPVKDCSSGVRNVSLGSELTSSGTQGLETDAEGRESGRKYSRNDSDELFPDGSKLAVDSRATERSKAATVGDDDLFPDDAKLLKHSETSRKSSNRRNSDENTLEISEDHFSPSPEERRKNRPAHPSRSSPPPSSSSTHSSSPGKLNSTGKKTAPPRPPRSPKLDSRLKLRQSQQSQSVLATTSTPPPSRRVLPSRVSPEIARVSTARRPLSASPPAPSRTIINETNTSEPSLKESPQTKATASECRGSLQSSSVAPHPQPSSPEVLPPTARTESVSDENEIDSVELPFLSLSIHLSLTLFLYFYYTLNPFAYLAGLVAGFLLFYLCLGAVFVAYVQREGEETAEGSRNGGSVAGELSVEFMKSTNIQLEDYKTRFTVSFTKL